MTTVDTNEVSQHPSHEGGRATHRFTDRSERCACGAELQWLEDEELVCPRQREGR